MRRPEIAPDRKRVGVVGVVVVFWIFWVGRRIIEVERESVWIACALVLRSFTEHFPSAKCQLNFIETCRATVCTISHDYTL